MSASSRLSAPAQALLATGLLGVTAFELVRVHAIYRALDFQIFVSPEKFPSTRFVFSSAIA